MNYSETIFKIAESLNSGLVFGGGLNWSFSRIIGKGGVCFGCKDGKTISIQIRSYVGFWLLKFARRRQERDLLEGI